jgi:uncharacterized protein (TIGR00730 family)
MTAPTTALPETSPTAPSPSFSVCVYCGSRNGSKPTYAEAARDVGRSIGSRGWQLVYGGGNVGLMGVVADAALEAGARVMGVIPRSLMQREVGHKGLHRQHVVETMHERKEMMASAADAFLAMPGGIGTLEELYEVWTWHQLGYHAKPIGLLNVDGYYDGLLSFMNHSAQQGFLDERQLHTVKVESRPEVLVDRLHREWLERGRATPSSDYTRT